MKLSKCATLILVMLMALYTAAEDDKAEGDDQEATPTAAPAIYLPVKPAFVVNYGGPGRLKYLKVELSVRLDNTDSANAVRRHLPFVRHKLVMLFSKQTDEVLDSQEGRETLRTQALEVVREVLMQEERKEGVVDLFFNTFIVQN